MDFIIHLFQLYDESGRLMLLYVLSVIGIWILEKSKRNKTAFIYSAWYLPLVLWNPLVGYCASAIGILPERLVRLYWLLPVFLVVSYALTLGFIKLEKKVMEQSVFCLAVALGVILWGKLFFSSEQFTVAENMYKLPNEVLGVVDLIYLDEKYDEKRAVLPPELSTYARLYNGDLMLAYGRYPSPGEDAMIYELYNQKTLDVETIVSYSKNNNFQYVCFDTEIPWMDYEEDSMSFIGAYENYKVFRID